MKVFTSTVLGSPAAECAHFGVCKVELFPSEQWDHFQPRHDRHVKSVLSLEVQGNVMQFEFPTNGMLPETEEMFFSSGFFRIDSPGFIPENIMECWGLPAHHILPGLYPLKKTNQAWLLLAAIEREQPTEANGKDPNFKKAKPGVAA